jgi:Ca2+-binding EF-hand superfamily protein
MRRAAAFLTFASLILFSGGCAGPRHQAAQEVWHPPSEMLEKYADKNGVVTRAAMEAGLRVDFAAADENHDGCLDASEARAVNAERWKENQSTASPLIDFHHNGCIDFDEFAATPRSLFDQLDKNGDGKLTPKELHAGRGTAGNGGS